MWKDLDVRGTPSVCCSGQELPGWMAPGVLTHKDTVPFRCSLEEPFVCFLAFPNPALL